MNHALNGFIGRLVHRAAVRRWTDVAEHGRDLRTSQLRRLRSMALQTRRQLDRVLRVAEERLARPLGVVDDVSPPAGFDWMWRPLAWRQPMSNPGVVAAQSQTQLIDGVTLYHDCNQSEIALRQIRSRSELDFAPFALRMEVFRFDGSFLSLVLELPREALENLRTRHVIRLDAQMELEHPARIYARLNVKHGPNTDELSTELALEDGRGVAEFDLAYTTMNEKRLEKIWLDLIFEYPQMNQVLLRDVTLGRRPRADL